MYKLPDSGWAAGKLACRDAQTLDRGRRYQAFVNETWDVIFHIVKRDGN